MSKILRYRIGNVALGLTVAVIAVLVIEHGRQSWASGTSSPYTAGQPLRGLVRVHAQPPRFVSHFQLRDLNNISISSGELLNHGPIVLRFGSFT